MSPRIYLAGPEVFLPDPLAVAARKKAACVRHGFVGVFPLDAGLDLTGLSGPEAGRRIAAVNEDLMRGCDLLIANMTPFRSPSMDPGTAYEMGFMRALGRPVLGYTTRTGDLVTRTRALLPCRPHAGGGFADPDGLLVEDFAMVDNLMMVAAVETSGSPVMVAETDGPIDGLGGFERCLRAAAKLFPNADR